MLTGEEQAFARRIGARLRRSADELDAATLSRLNRARQRALAQVANDSAAGRGWWLPVGATAAAVIAVGLWRMTGPDDIPASAATDFAPVVAEDAADFELLLEEGALEMLEDLEFFAWLAVEELETAG
jgi:hypothetical protein